MQVLEQLTRRVHLEKERKLVLLRVEVEKSKQAELDSIEKRLKEIEAAEKEEEEVCF